MLPVLLEVLRPNVLLIILTQWAMAISLVFLNKRLVSSDHEGRDMTVFIAWSQCLFSVTAIFIITAVKRCLSSNTPWISIPLMTFLHSDILAMTFTFIGVIVMNNLLLKHIGVAFYQVARSSTLIFTVIFSRVLLGVPVSFRVMMSCVLIILGFVVSVDQEMLISSLSPISIFYGISASLSAALGGIFAKRADKLVQGNSLGISLTSNMNSVIFLFPLMVSTGQLQFSLNSDRFWQTSLWTKLAASGFLSLLVGWASIKVISLTSPLTHHMSINAKSLIQTLIAVMIQGESKTAAWWLGNLLIMLGIVNYSLSKDPPQDSQHMKEAENVVTKADSSDTDVASKKKSILSV